MVAKRDVLTIRELLRKRRKAHQQDLWREVERLTAAATEMGVQRVILFRSLLRENPGLASDLDLLIVWDIPLSFLDRTAELYRRLQPGVSADLSAYTPDEMKWTWGQVLILERVQTCAGLGNRELDGLLRGVNRKGRTAPDYLIPDQPFDEEKRLC